MIMNIYDDLYQQLNKLVNTIPNCNFINPEDKKDIVQNSILQLHKKIDDGKISTDFNEIKGYSFLTLRNFCNGYKNKIKEKETTEFFDIPDTPTSSLDDEIEYNKYLHSVVKDYLSQTKYNQDDKMVGECLLEDMNDKEIEIKTGLTKDQIRKHKFKIKNMLKFDLRRQVKFIVKNINNKNIQVPCFSAADAKNYLSHMEQRMVTNLKNSGAISEDGYYIEVLIPKKKKNKI